MGRYPGISPSPTMNTLLSLLLAGSAIARPSSDDTAAVMTCVAGTSVASKLEQAFTKCFGASARKIGQAKKMERMNKCYSFAEIMEWAKNEYSDDACVLMAIGWMDDNMVMDEATMMADLSALDSAVTDPLFKKGEQCMKIGYESMIDEYKMYICDDLQWEQGEQLDMLAKHISGYECFLQLFEEGCTNFIKGDNREVDLNRGDSKAVEETMECVAGTPLEAKMEMDEATMMADLGALDSTVTDPLKNKGEKCAK